VSTVSHRSLALAAALVAILALPGCSAHRGPSAAPPPGAAPPTPVAILPLEELSGRAGAAEKFTRIVFTELVARGGWDVVDPGQVDGVLALSRLRSTGVMSRAQVRLIADSLHVPYLLTGASMEYGRVRTPDGEVPSVGLSLRLIEGRSGRVLWAEQRFRSGDDHETVFGWGRQDDPDRLAQLTVADLLTGLRPPAADTAAARTGAAPAKVDTAAARTGAAPAKADTAATGGRP
jgi:polysaccharide biosynthesis protein PelC